MPSAVLALLSIACRKRRVMQECCQDRGLGRDFETASLFWVKGDDFWQGRARYLGDLQASLCNLQEAWLVEDLELSQELWLMSKSRPKRELLGANGLRSEGALRGENISLDEGYLRGETAPFSETSFWLANGLRGETASLIKGALRGKTTSRGKKASLDKGNLRGKTERLTGRRLRGKAALRGENTSRDETARLSEASFWLANKPLCAHKPLCANAPLSKRALQSQAKNDAKPTKSRLRSSLKRIDKQTTKQGEICQILS